MDRTTLVWPKSLFVRKRILGGMIVVVGGVGG